MTKTRRFDLHEDTPIIAFDTETTDKEPQEAHIITWGVARPDGSTDGGLLQLPEGFGPLDPDNIAVHGMDEEYIAKGGDDRKAGIVAAYEALREASESGKIIVGHNLGYDFTVLARELERIGEKARAKKLGTFPVFDTVVWLRAQFGFDISLKLEHAARTLGVDEKVIKNAHNAEADALMSLHLAGRVEALFPELLVLTDEELFSQQEKHAAAYAAKASAIFKEPLAKGFPVYERPKDSEKSKKKEPAPKRTSRANRSKKNG